MELKNAIKQAGQEAGIDNNGLSLFILIFCEVSLYRITVTSSNGIIRQVQVIPT